MIFVGMRYSASGDGHDKDGRAIVRPYKANDIQLMKGQIKMGKVVTGYSMSLDGFIAGKNDDVQNLFGWYFAGDTEFPMPSREFNFRISAASAKRLDEAMKNSGVLVTGRHQFDLANAWNGRHPMDVPIVVLTHRVPQEWVDRADSPFTFVTDGIESAIAAAQRIAGDKDVVLSTAQTTQQALKANLVDEIHIDLVPILLGEGVPLFAHLGIEPIMLEQLEVIEGIGVTHLGYRVIK